MEKTIKIGEKDVRLSNNIGWALIYRDQFGRDIIPTIMPMLAGLLDMLGGLLRNGKTDSLTMEDLAELMDGDELMNAYVHLSGLEFADFINITWALAKCADDSIPEPTMWVRQFEEFPVDVIGPAVFSLVLKGVMSSKNWKRLTSLKDKIQPLKSTLSSSQGSSVDLP